MVFKKFFKSDAHVPHRKNTEQAMTQPMALPSKVYIPLLQHIGVVLEPLVAKGDVVYMGQILGDSQKMMAAPIHSSVSGTVTDISSMLYAGGTMVPTIEITTDGLQTPWSQIQKPVWTDKQGFLSMVRASGLVGLGGAGFPTHIKLNPPQDKPIDTLIINGAECEPYITSDYREMLENTQALIEGCLLVKKELNIPRVLIGIEDNKGPAITLLTEKTSGLGIEIKSLPASYPQGAEKVLINELTGRKIPTGKLPSDVGVLVMNVTSVIFLGNHVKTGMPLISKKVTVDGNCVKSPQNLSVLIGTRIEEVFAAAGGFTKDPTKVLMGGPMMGVAQHTLNTSVVKHTNALLALDATEGDLPDQGACIRCGRCTRVCPMKLLPLELNRSALHGDIESLQKYHIMDCIECGSCSYVCPAKIHLVQGIRLGKAKIRMTAVPGGKK